jgi:hypothetical protein
MANAKKRRAKRKPVSREERQPATPETLAKLRPCPLKTMLHLGATNPEHKAGMQPDQYEAALQIWDANDALVKGLKAGAVDVDKIANSHGGLSDGKARLVQIYLQWASELGGRFFLTSGTVLGWINDEPYGRMVNDQQRWMLTRACDHWIRVKQAHDRANRVERSTIVHEREMVMA